MELLTTGGSIGAFSEAAAVERIGAPAFDVDLKVGIEPKSSDGFASKPVAITVMIISSSSLESNATPHVMFASGCAFYLMDSQAFSISSRPISGEDVMLMITPFAPAIDVSSSGLDVAISAA